MMRPLLLLVSLLLFSFVLADSIPSRDDSHLYEPILSNFFAVELTPGSLPSIIAERHGMKHIKSLKSKPNFHLFEKPEILGKIQKHFPHLSSSKEVRWFEQQVSHKLFKRDDSYFTDPLFRNQWHLHDSPYSDLNVEGVWDLEYLGDGVLISIVDDGLDYTHPDIFHGYVEEASYDVNSNDPDPSPSIWDIHGTEAAGVAMARNNNGFCGVGVAPRASVAAIRLLAANTVDFDEAEALQYRNDIVDIYSNSWGPYDDANRLEGPGALTLAAFNDSVTNGRNGKGSIFIWAAGNGGASQDNCNYDGYANSRFTIAVAAIGKNGKSVYYSEQCSALVVSAPSSDSVGDQITTCGTNTQCKSNFGGTSAACPMVAGVVALCLEANPELGWRDVQGVLIESAFLNDPNSPGWVTNGAGYKVHHSYGFGKVDASRAVEVALEWQNFDQSLTVTSETVTLASNIPDRGSFYETAWTCREEIIIEHVELIVNIRHPARGQLQIILISPSGTESILADSHGDNNSNILNWKYMTIRNWGESSEGQWKIRVTDKTSGATGTFQSYKIIIYGH